MLSLSPSLPPSQAMKITTLIKQGEVLPIQLPTSLIPPAKYDSYFVGIDKDRDGLVSGEEARGLFMASNLPQQVLAHIW